MVSVEVHKDSHGERSTYPSDNKRNIIPTESSFA